MAYTPFNDDWRVLHDDYRYKQIYIDVQYVEFCSEVTAKSTNIRQHVNMICNSLVHMCVVDKAMLNPHPFADTSAC